MRWLPNNNRLFLAHEPQPEEYQKQVKDVEISPWWPIRKRGSVEKQLGGEIYEVTSEKKIVWEWHSGDLFPRIGFIVTNMSANAEGVVRFYKGRGIAEQWKNVNNGEGFRAVTKLNFL